ncbi:MAG: hypothetical protein ACKVQB_13390 [Bacteroidia bacterium]
MRFLFGLLILLSSFPIYSQRREIEFVFNPIVFFKFDNIRDKQLSIHYKYKFDNEFLTIITCTGIDYIENRNSWSNLQIQKLIVPVVINSSLGNQYRLYGGLGIYGSTNLNQKRTVLRKPTLLQAGYYCNLGCQFKIRKKISFNTELKYLKDVTATFLAMNNDRRGNENMQFISINFGFTYRLRNKKN